MDKKKNTVPTWVVFVLVFVALFIIAIAIYYVANRNKKEPDQIQNPPINNVGSDSTTVVDDDEDNNGEDDYLVDDEEEDDGEDDSLVDDEEEDDSLVDGDEDDYYLVDDEEEDDENPLDEEEDDENPLDEDEESDSNTFYVPKYIPLSPDGSTTKSQQDGYQVESIYITADEDVSHNIRMLFPKNVDYPIYFYKDFILDYKFTSLGPYQKYSLFSPNIFRWHNQINNAKQSIRSLGSEPVEKTVMVPFVNKLKNVYDRHPTRQNEDIDIYTRTTDLIIYNDDEGEASLVPSVNRVIGIDFRGNIFDLADAKIENWGDKSSSIRNLSSSVYSTEGMTTVHLKENYGHVTIQKILFIHSIESDQPISEEDIARTFYDLVSNGSYTQIGLVTEDLRPHLDYYVHAIATAGCPSVAIDDNQKSAHFIFEFDFSLSHIALKEAHNIVTGDIPLPYTNKGVRLFYENEKFRGNIQHFNYNKEPRDIKVISRDTSDTTKNNIVPFKDTPIEIADEDDIEYMNFTSGDITRYCQASVVFPYIKAKCKNSIPYYLWYAGKLCVSTTSNIMTHAVTSPKYAANNIMGDCEVRPPREDTGCAYTTRLKTQSFIRINWSDIQSSNEYDAYIYTTNDSYRLSIDIDDKAIRIFSKKVLGETDDTKSNPDFSDMNTKVKDAKYVAVFKTVNGEYWAGNSKGDYVQLGSIRVHPNVTEESEKVTRNNLQ